MTRFVWKYTWHKNDVKCRDFFRNFVEEHIPKTKVYYSNEELKEDLPDCDAFISGSDQIWNTDFSWDKQRITLSSWILCRMTVKKLHTHPALAKSI